MRSKITNTFVAFGLGTTLLVAGCGGGGGGTTSSVTYSGITAQAVVTNENAEALLETALNAGEGLNTAYGVATSTDEAAPSGLSLSELAKVLANVAERPRMTAPETATGISSSFSYTDPGDCGGTATYNGTYTYIEYPYSYTEGGSAVFNNYCTTTSEGNVIQNGGATYSLTDTDTELNLSLTASNLMVSFGGETVAYNMQYALNIDYDTSVMTVTMDADYRTQDGKVYRVEDYRLEFANFSSLTISGRIYHPDHGYVDISTPEALLFTFCGEIYRPTSGTLRVTGAEGTSAEFHALGCNEYQVCVTDGSTVCTTHSW